jgi:hypothetical protein
MMEEPIVIPMNVARHRAMLKVDMDDQSDWSLKRPLAEVTASLS